jgi:hypothetical protein
VPPVTSAILPSSLPMIFFEPHFGLHAVDGG